MESTVTNASSWQKYLRIRYAYTNIFHFIVAVINNLYLLIFSKKLPMILPQPLVTASNQIFCTLSEFLSVFLPSLTDTVVKIFWFHWFIAWQIGMESAKKSTKTRKRAITITLNITATPPSTSRKMWTKELHESQLLLPIQWRVYFRVPYDLAAKKFITPAGSMAWQCKRMKTAKNTVLHSMKLLLMISFVINHCLCKE